MVENVLSESNRVNTNIWQTVNHRRTSKKELSYANASKKILTYPPKENFAFRSTVINVDTTPNKVATLQLPSSKRLLNNYNTNTIAALQKEHNFLNKKKKYRNNTISSVSTANKIHNAGKSGSSNKSQIANGSAPLPRRKRLNQIRQIKRAHRHLLTSGGNDKQQPTLQSQRAVNKINYHANSCSAKKTLQKNAHSSGCGRESGALSTSRVNKNKNNKLGNYSCDENIQSSSQYHTYNRQAIKKKRVKSINQTSSESVTSSRWCSIEKQLDLLEKLLSYCDEEENIVLQDWHRQLNANYCSNQATSCLQSENEEADLASVNDWSWSDIMSNQSISSSKECRNDYVCTTQLNMSLVPSTLKRRGHQHHPRFSGTRRSNVAPNVQEILDALNKREVTPSHVQSEVSETEASLSTLDESYSAQSTDEPDDDPAAAQRIKAALNLPLTDSVTTSLGSNSPTPDDSSMVDEGVISAQMPQSSCILANAMTTQMPKEKKLKIKRDKNASEQTKDKKCKKLPNSTKRDKQKRSSGCLETAAEISTDTGSAATDEGIAIDDDDMQTAEWAKLRCTSEAAEIVAEREARRSKNRCSDYPGLAFGRSIFSSDTMMKFNIIRNELHNIMNTQLKRVISESNI
uniref:Uncharacterized protein n=1 Tax=Glossina austeni TaxID=7395 RepID=A0A1A9VE86_GLOAU